ncbi:MAG: hypothetical protein AABZ33_14025 [Chloroflexota bacterium]
MGATTLPRNALDAALAWRPMEFGSRPARDVRNPIVEPAWNGPRVLVLVTGSTVDIRDERGDRPAVAVDLAQAIAAAVAVTGTETAILDGHLTAAPMRGTVGVGVGLEALDGVHPADMGRQLLLGGSNRRDRRRDRLEADLARRAPIPAEGPLAFVAIDLLWIDDTPLVDVPLLERKRLLESVLAESEPVRTSVHVRPPLEAWYGQWRAFGFHEVAVRDANGRYRPGERADDWATALIPRR